MTYEKFIEEYLSKGLLKEQKSSFPAVEKLINRSLKDLKAAKANLSIDEGIAYTVGLSGDATRRQGIHASQRF